MAFNTYLFIFAFLPGSFLIYFVCNYFKKFKLADISLIVMSSIFFLYNSVYSLLAVWISVLVNYLLVKIIKQTNKKKIWLTIGVVGNCAALLYLKYVNFFIDNYNALFHSDIGLKNLILPLGLSYFTFQQIAYLVDNYRDNGLDYSFLEYSLFVLFFPKVLAGPILTHSDIMPQFRDRKKRKIDFDNVSRALYAISIGMVKKVLLADIFGQFVDAYYADIPSMNTTIAILAVLAYAFQLYFDFSGYCDIVTGVCLLFNIDIPINFDSPYKSCSIIEFWDRWHITLTRFFTKYLYIPLGGSRKGKVLTYVNTLIVFLVSGLWHGADWSFVVWGLMHGVMLCFNKIFKKTVEKWNTVFSWIITFGFVNFAWIFFRASNLAEAVQVIKQIVVCDFGDIGRGMAKIFELPEITTLLDALNIRGWLVEKLPYFSLCGFFVLAFVLILNSRNVNEQIADFKPTIRKAAFTAIVMVWSIISFAGVGTFIYSGF